ncbi:MAG: GNAT family N-acetyltransferase [Ruminococcus sp.]
MIRQAVRADLPAVYQLICALEETVFSEELFTWGYDAMTADPNHVLLVAESGGRVVGVLHLRMEFQLHHCGKVAEIMELVVDAKHRSQGIGKQLLAGAETAAGERHCQILEVTSNQKRKKAHEFYLRKGMQNTHYKFVEVIAPE